MTIEIELKNGNIETMPVEEFSRWMCLVEALHFIKTKADELNVDYTKLLKPLAIDEYIKERYHAMQHDVIFEHQLGNI
jgi:hypothetical protein